MSRYAKACAFICEHCGTQVSTRVAKKFTRNACPYCHWSKHVMFGGELGYPPCGGMMKPHVLADDDDGCATWRCLDCGFMMTGPTEQATDEIATGKRKSCRVVAYKRLAA